MNDKLFSVPVRLSLKPGSQRLVASAWEAVECLRRQWPGRRGASYRSAIQVCLDVLDGLRPARDARRAFKAAAREAGVLAQS